MVALNNSTIAYGEISTLCFLNLTDGVTTYYRALNKILDGVALNGVSCVAGHKTQSIFAFGEMSYKTPKIVLLTYPSLMHVTTLENHETNHSHYIGLDFSETEHLIAISAIPECFFEIWNWRTKKLLIIERTDLLSDDQLIKYVLFDFAISTYKF